MVVILLKGWYVVFLISNILENRPQHRFCIGGPAVSERSDQLAGNGDRISFVVSQLHFEKRIVARAPKTARNDAALIQSFPVCVIGDPAVVVKRNHGRKIGSLLKGHGEAPQIIGNKNRAAFQTVAAVTGKAKRQSKGKTIK